jgi:HSP20 family protein
MANPAIEKRTSEAQTPERLEQGVYFTPLVDIAETNDEFIFQADVPGVKTEDLDISFEDGVLTIDGRVKARRPENQQYVWEEYGVGHFYRSFNIDTPVKADAIKAELKNGELTLHVPKAESARTRKIEIKAS